MAVNNYVHVWFLYWLYSLEQSRARNTQGIQSHQVLCIPTNFCLNLIEKTAFLKRYENKNNCVHLKNKKQKQKSNSVDKGHVDLMYASNIISAHV